jgi:hypothetical protein
LSCGFWDYWVPGGNEPLAKLCQEWAAKEKIDFITTQGDKLNLTIAAKAGEIRARREWLKQVVSGFSNYYAVPTNVRTLVAFRYHVIDLWRRTLRRRSQKHRMTWQQIGTLADQWLPKPRILHPWPSQRFTVKHPRWEPYAGKPHVRFCAGGAQ